MPEGDSLHRTAERLRPLVGFRVTATSPHPRGLVTGVAAAVDGRRLEGVEAVEKHLLLRFEGGVTLRSHLRMKGRRLDRAVYRRAGRACPRCGGVIVARGQGGANRTAYWCAGCQRGPVGD